MNYKLGGLYVITDSKLMPGDLLFKKSEAALKGGANIIQLRDKTNNEQEVIEIGKKLLTITKKYRVPLIINDDPQIAKIVGADGVHLGEEDPDIQTAREILGKDSIVGVTCYNELENGLIAEKKGADYVAFGTPYSTPTKPGRKPTSLETLIEASKQISIPVFAIGGIFPENAKDILATGVDGIAVITSVFGVNDPEQAVRKFSQILSINN